MLFECFLKASLALFFFFNRRFIPLRWRFGQPQPVERAGLGPALESAQEAGSQDLCSYQALFMMSL